MCEYADVQMKKNICGLQTQIICTFEIRISAHLKSAHPLKAHTHTGSKKCIYANG